jgi:hypothetical protein
LITIVSFEEPSQAAILDAAFFTAAGPKEKSSWIGMQQSTPKAAAVVLASFNLLHTKAT